MYFEVDDVRSAHGRAVTMSADIFDELHENSITHAIEFSLRDPDGYAITVSQKTEQRQLGPAALISSDT